MKSAHGSNRMHYKEVPRYDMLFKKCFDFIIKLFISSQKSSLISRIFYSENKIGNMINNNIIYKLDVDIVS